ncbi:mercury transporter [Wohlfahrtiimonas chitiniclastica]|uniref:heavy-metal-associated domain-containing protein n=1 Tax=Wohlfahrtiimonas chitiniclastica TaxID=400946 RepID=UPI0007B69B0F|nr:heavy-metal-associated domain-containing protein [Wohlfahrtiimonas chitiniclastica]KZX37183.1 mercury transporter [Wohlfahrtiimonas chitiniclastica]MBS7820989.1 heavy-metal-associated domain-containing protein [Wohlfahrtiimonas chitiniclastica]OYQ69653.1 mercury transporter [Wohlfahrtiimonas chitiniclastica]OYQ81062.1 mercury transporter [Wohlfahrtiimonas chitiniclastica]OYQ85818.1 mercury transporter [Wohlfahrtiimonas chitiniclastica]
MQNITLSVPDISCGHCTSSIENGLSKLAGIDAVSADVATKTAQVTFDDATLSINDILDALDDLGFEAKVI